MKKNLFTAMAGLLSLTACNSGPQEVYTTAQSDGEAVIANILTRTSIRAYTAQPVGRDTIETLLRTGMAAPTAVNSQPWHFVAVTDREKLNGIAEANPNAAMARKAPLAIVVCGDMDKALEGTARDFWVQDCAAATENILLAAHALGLGAVWTGLYPNEERAAAVRTLLKLPEAMVPLCAIVIGHPAQQPKPKDKWKSDNVSYNEYGGLTADTQAADTYLAAIDRYLVDAISIHYSEADIHVPLPKVIDVDDTHDGDIKVWGDFWVMNFNLVGDTLKMVSGGSHPGLMHMRQTEKGYEVTAFEQVGDGALFEKTAKKIFGDKYDDFMAVYSNHEKRNRLHEQLLAEYVKKHGIRATMYQDNGQAAKSLNP